MKKIKAVVEKYPDKVRIGEFLQLAKKDERGVPQSTGVHKVKLLRGEFGKRDTQYHHNQQGIELYFEEDGEEVKYFVPMWGDDKKFHYLFERFKDIEEGSMLELEYKREGKRGYIDVREIGGEEEIDEDDGERKLKKISKDDIPIIEEDDSNVPPEFHEDYPEDF